MLAVRTGDPSTVRPLDHQYLSRNGSSYNLEGSKITLNNEEWLKQIEQRIRKALYSLEDERAMLAMRDGDAQRYVDAIQDMLDTSSSRIGHQGYQVQSEPPVFCRLRRLLYKLAEASDKYPSSLFLHEVYMTNPNPIYGGSSSDIYHGSYRGKDVALKRLRIFQDTHAARQDAKKFCREVLIWRQLRHPYIQHFYGIDRTTCSWQLCMVSPWLSNGNIHQYMKRWENSLNVPKDPSFTIHRWIREIAEGLAYLHQERVVHGDLRGPNILIDDDLNIRLTDLGLTVMVDATYSSTGSDSARWMAPELLDPEEYDLPLPQLSFATDVYAFACVCIEIFTSKPPFAERRCSNDRQLILPVLKGVRPARPNGGAWRTMSDEVWNLVNICWHDRAASRPAAAEVAIALKGYSRVEPVVANLQDGGLEVERSDISYSSSKM